MTGVDRTTPSKIRTFQAEPINQKTDESHARMCYIRVRQPAQRLTVGHLPDSTHLTATEQQYSTYITAVLSPQLRAQV
jgi:hypothetical protein